MPKQTSLEYLQEILNTNNFTADCVNWSFCKTADGYGRVRINGYTKRAHRESFQRYYKIDLTGSKYQVLHECDNTSCINPLHLFIGTSQDNMQDMAIKNRQSRGKKMKEADVIWVLENVGTYTQQELADKVGVQRKQINNIVCGRRWGHLQQQQQHKQQKRN